MAIDRGGTFYDVISRIDGREPVIFKLLSQDPPNYRDARTEAIRRVLETVEGRSVPGREAGWLEDCDNGFAGANGREVCVGHDQGRAHPRKEVLARLTVIGFADICAIRDQIPSKLFDMDVRKAKALHESVIEVDERVTIEDYDLSRLPMGRLADPGDPALIKTLSDDSARVLEKPDLGKAREQLQWLRAQGST